MQPKVHVIILDNISEKIDKCRYFIVPAAMICIYHAGMQELDDAIMVF
jgi:hypothetical protein